MVQWPVITSYSIHYTKLYEVTSEVGPPRGCNLDVIKEKANMIVITSYSIHYTKLYDMVLGQEAPGTNTTIFGLFWYLIRQEIPRAVLPVLISVVLMIIGLFTPVSLAIIAISSVVAGIRITSYNVCYTKLLRNALKLDHRVKG